MRTLLRSLLRPPGARRRGPARRLLVPLLAVGLVPAAVGVSLVGLEVGEPVVCDAGWDGGAGTRSWHDPANWLDDTLPGPQDVTCVHGDPVEISAPVTVGSVHGESIALVSGGLTVTGASELYNMSVSGGTLTVQDALSVTVQLTQTGGEVTGAGAINVAGPLVWSAGTQTGTGSSYSLELTLPAGTDRSISGRQVSSSAIAFTGDGSVRLADDDAQLWSVGSFTVSGHAAKLLGSGQVGAQVLEVLGTDDSPGSLLVEPVLDTTSMSSVLARGNAVLDLRGPGTQNGGFRVENGAVLDLRAGQDFTAEASFEATSDSYFQVRAGTTRMAAPGAVLGRVRNIADLVIADDASAENVGTFGTVTVEDGVVFDVSGAEGYLQGADPDNVLWADAPQESLTNLAGAGSILAVGNGGQVELYDGSTLSGAGKVAGPVLNHEAVVDPAGVLRVAGAYTQNDSGTLAIGRSDGGAWDRLAVEGTATLAGSLSLPLGGIVPSAPVDVLTTSSRLGEFGLVLGDLVQCGDVRYGDNAVTLVPASCVAVTDTTAAEASGTVRFPVTLTEPRSEPVRVEWSTAEGTAKAGDDFVAASGTAIIAAGETSAAIDVALVDDDKHEAEEVFTVNLSSPDARLVGTSAKGTVTDDDEAPLELDVRDIAGGWAFQTAGIGSEMVVGWRSYDADDLQAWLWRIEDGAFGYSQVVPLISGINADDDVVGSCARAGATTAACFRSNRTTTWLRPENSGGLATPLEVNRNDVIIGYLGSGGDPTTAVRWATPDAEPEPVGPASGVNGRAEQISDSGWVAGTTSYGTGADAYLASWVQSPEGELTTIGPLSRQAEFPYMRVTAVAEDGTVYGLADDKSAGTNDQLGWKWSAEGGLVELGVNNVISATNAKGQAVGHLDGVPTLIKPNGDKVDLRTALGGEQDWRLLSVTDINEQGVIVGRAYPAGSDTAHVVALVPPGAGCVVCVDFTATEGRYPNAGVRAPVEQSTVDGNLVQLSAGLSNQSESPRTVEVTFLDQAGEPLGAAQTVTLGPNAVADPVAADWDTTGLAWDAAGKPTVAQVVAVQLKDTAGGAVKTYEKAVRVDPRPVIAVHGMNSDASTWATYPQFLHDINPNWDAYAVDTMDTMPWLPNTIRDNAGLMASFVRAKQITENAWHVDLVAHSMGGLISRYYLHNLMPTNPDGTTVVNRLVMLGTPNAGSPCADLFDVPLTKELRTDSVARFNERVTDTRGVPLSVAAGVHLPYTCDEPETGDDVVSVASAQTGVTDSELYEMAHTEMTASATLFKQFVLPRLNGTFYPTSGLTRHSGEAALAATAETAASATTAATGRSPQLLQIDPVALEPGESADVGLFVPDAAASAGLAMVAAPTVTVEIIKGGEMVASLPAGDGIVRTVPLPSPIAGEYLLRFTNTGAEPVQTESSAWVTGLPKRLVAHARQVDGAGKAVDLLVTAALEGGSTDPARTTVSATVNPPDGTTLSIKLFDDGTHGDGAAGDGTFGATVPDVAVGPYAVGVFLIAPQLSLATTTSTDVELVEDLPGDQAPVARPTTVVTSRDKAAEAPLSAIDPEGADVTYEVLSQPAHGTLSGTAPALRYTPERGYLGPDSFTWRASDGTNWSTTATTSITVGPALTEIIYHAPLPPEGVQGGTIEVTMRLVGPDQEGANGVPVEFRLGEHVVSAQTAVNGGAKAKLPMDMAAGDYDLVITSAGTAQWAPATYTQRIKVHGGSAPAPSLPDGATGEAGYPMRLRISAGDPDGDAVRFQIDYTDDGTWDDESGPMNDFGVAWFDHTYPEAVEGSVRVKVTDGAGHATEHTEPLHVAAHRPLGALSTVRLDGAPVNAAAVSDDGKKVLVQVRDTEGDQALPTPYRVLDLATGESVVASVAPDGKQVDSPGPGAISTDGRYVAFSVLEQAGEATQLQTYLRDTQTGETKRISVRPDGGVADGGTFPLDVSTDGRFVLVMSTSHDYTDADVDRCSGGACLETYLLDTQERTATLVSLDAGGRPAAQVSGVAAMTPDAGLVVANGRNRATLYDRATGELTAVPLAGSGDLPDVSGAISELDLSDDGRYVLFTTEVPGVDPSDDSPDSDSYRYDRATGDRVLVSATPAGTSSAGATTMATMDGTGSRVAFTSWATDLVAGADGQVLHVYLRDLAKGTTQRMSQEARDGTTGLHDSMLPRLAGPELLFASDAQNLMPGDINGERDLFRYLLGQAAPPPNTAPTVTVRAPESVAEGGEVELIAAGVDADGDELTYDWRADGGELAGSGNAVRLVGTDGPADVPVTVIVSDGTATAEATVTVRVDNVKPTVDAGADVSVPWGVPAQLHGVVTDPSAVDTAEGLSPRWTFGDGGSADGVDASHTWAAPGTATAQLAAVDKDGATGSDTVTVTVTKRATALRLASTPGPFGFAGVTAEVTDPLAGPIAGRKVVFTVDGKALPAAVTDAAGKAVLPTCALPPGTHKVSAAVVEDALYLAANADAATVKVTNTAGKATGQLTVDGGSATFTANSDGKTAKGSLTWKDNKGTFTAAVKALGIGPDRRSAWFTGTYGTHRVLVYVQDNGESGVGDIFRLWVDNTLRTPTGVRKTGNLQVHKP